MSTRRMTALDLPGLDDTYTYVQADSSLSLEGEAADAKATGDALLVLAGKDAELARRVDKCVTEQTNLYDKTTRTVGGSISSSGEVTVSSEIYDCSDYIPVVAGKTYMGKVYKDGSWATGPFASNGNYATYTANKTFIARASAANLISGVTMGETVAYIRVMIRKDTISTAPEYAIIAEADKFPYTYVGYGEFLQVPAGMLSGAISSIAPVQYLTASANIAAGELLMQGGKMYKATQAIASGAAITPGTNVTAATVADYLLGSRKSISQNSSATSDAEIDTTNSYVVVYPAGFAVLVLKVTVKSELTGRVGTGSISGISVPSWASDRFVTVVTDAATAGQVTKQVCVSISQSGSAVWIGIGPGTAESTIGTYYACITFPVA